MGSLKQAVSVGVVALSSALLVQSCIGPFAKKSGGGGGGGGGAASTSTSTSTATSTTNSGSTSTLGSTSTSTTTDTSTDTSTNTGTTVPPPPTAKDGYGCLQGLVINGFTGQPVDLKGLTDPNGIYILDHGNKLKAAVITGDDNLQGQYYICDIPLDETYPVFAFLNGYLPFQSTTNIHGSRAIDINGTSQAITGEAKIIDPLAVANIALWPVGNTDRPLKVHVVHNGTGVANATVDAEPIAASDHFAFKGTFANGADEYLLPIETHTDADGWATFDAAKMSLGARYNVTVTPPSTSDLTTGKSAVSGTAAAFTFGVDGATLDNAENNYELTIVLDSANADVAIVSCSLEYQDFSTTGAITYIFNRDIAGPINPNAMVASLTDADAGFTAHLPDNDTGNVASEQVAFSYSQRKVTISPRWDGTNGVAPKTPDASKPSNDGQNVDRNLFITYDLSKIFIKVAGDLDTNMKAMSTITMPPGCSPATTRFFAKIY